jgi:hypothetical protein
MLPIIPEMVAVVSFIEGRNNDVSRYGMAKYTIHLPFPLGLCLGLPVVSPRQTGQASIRRWLAAPDRL